MPDAITRLNAAPQGCHRIESELGEGGMATVYLAGDLKHGRKVALKVFKPALAAALGWEHFLAGIHICLADGQLAGSLPEPDSTRSAYHTLKP